MKRILAFSLAILALLLAGCGKTAPDLPQDRFTFVYEGVSIAPGADAAPILQALGAPESYTEEPSCAFAGLDRTYGYGCFYLSTCEMDGTEQVYSLWFADDTAKTADGIGIGTSQAQVESILGADTFSGLNAYVLTGSECKLVVVIGNGAVTSVRYELLPE